MSEAAMLKRLERMGINRCRVCWATIDQATWDRDYLPVDDGIELRPAGSVTYCPNGHSTQGTLTKPPLRRRIAQRATERFVDPYGKSVSASMRARRWTELLRRFPDLADMCVVDLGGDPRHWKTCPVQPAELVFVNLASWPVEGEARVVVGDACEPIPELEGERFDLAYSNSVIEHVGGHHRRQRFAETHRALADHLWAQTPYRYFPVEPHWLCPGLQFLPDRLRTAAAARWPYGRGGRTQEFVFSVELLCRTQMRFYFPDADLWTERVAGLPKSLVAVT